MLKNKGIIPKYSSFKITSRDGKKVWAKLRIVCGFMQRNAFDATDKGTLFMNLFTVRSDLVTRAFHLVQPETFAALGPVFTAHVPMAMRCIGPGAEQASIEKLVRRDVETRKERGLIDTELKCSAAHYAACNIWVDLITAIRLKIGYPLTFAQVQEALTDKNAFDLLRVHTSTNIAALNLQRTNGTDVKVLTELTGPHADYEWGAYDLFLVSVDCKRLGSDAEAQLYIKDTIRAGNQTQFAIYCLHKRTREYVNILANTPAVEAVAQVQVPVPAPAPVLMALESNEKTAEKEASVAEPKEKEKSADAEVDVDAERSSVKEAAVAKNTANENRAERRSRADTQQTSRRRKKTGKKRKAAFQDAED